MNELDIVNKLDRFDQLIHQQAFNDADAYHKAKKLSLEILEYLPKCHFLGWEIYHKYSEKISSLNERIIKKAAPFVKFKLPEIFQEFQKFDKLLYTVNCKPQERAFTELFLEPMINGICEEIENSQDTSQGIVYRVTNAQGVQHFLVGTCHTSTENMTKAPLLKHALAKSEELHLESNSPILWNLYKIRQLNLPNPYRYSVDYTLRNSAIEQNKPVHGLEKIVWENIIHLNFQAICQSTITEASNHLDSAIKIGVKHGPLVGLIHFYSAPIFCLINQQLSLAKSWIEVFKNKKTKAQNHVNTKRVYTALLQHYWQQGNHAGFINAKAAFKNIQEELLEIRNLEWLKDKNDRKGILSTLKDPKPSCYAVGTFHLFGEEGLLQHLIHNGFKIEKGVYHETGISWE